MKLLSQEERRELRKMVREKYESQISAILAEHPRLEEQIDKKATEEALSILGVDKLVKQKESLEAQIEDLEKAAAVVEAQIDAKMPRQKSTGRNSCPTRLSLCEAVNEKKTFLLPNVKAKSTTYKRILKIEAERDAALRQLEKVCSRDQLNGLLD